MITHLLKLWKIFQVVESKEIANNLKKALRKVNAQEYKLIQ